MIFARISVNGSIECNGKAIIESLSQEAEHLKITMKRLSLMGPYLEKERKHMWSIFLMKDGG